MPHLVRTPERAERDETRRSAHAGQPESDRSLRSLLGFAVEDIGTAKLAREGGHAFVSSALRPYLVAALADSALGGGTEAASHRHALRQQPLLVVVGDDRAARDLAGDLRAWLSPREVRYYPSRGVTYESHLSPPPHLVGLRMAALDALLRIGPDERPEPPVVVVSAVALSEKVPPLDLRPQGFRLRVGERADLFECAEALVAAGYERVEQVEERGQFALRGGLLDVFAVTAERAVRADLFGDEIESLRWFSTFTQRSLGETDEVEIAPARELAEGYRGTRAATGVDDSPGIEARLGDLAADDGTLDIAELLPVERFQAPLALLEEGISLVVAAEEELRPSLEEHWADVCAAFHDEDAHHLYVSPDEIQATLARRARIWLSAIASDQDIELRAQAAQPVARSWTEAEGQLERLVQSGYRTVVAFPQRGEGERAAYNLARLQAQWLHGPPPPSSLRFVEASLRDGFVAPQWRLAVLPEQRLYQRRRAVRSREGTAPGPRLGRLRSFADLRTGDIVVHEDHGVARFAGFQTRTVAGVTRDYLYLEFQGDDRVWVPTDQLAKISRYMSAGAVGAGHAPPLSRLGGARWDAMKARAKRAAQELAGELLNLYAQRASRMGFAFGEDSEWQRELEERFPFTETDDQLEAIELVKADMEAAQPMDRLICGDVGYGKTEVALRAAFKAALAGKQVLMLAPTTILVQQHYGTFSERLGDYPINVDQVSRLRSPAQQREVLRGFREGRVDILIGTHRLLSQDVRAKELGLLIVDEEQRFGVKQKEFLRALKLSVDVISMSATPIPRTLQISLSGLRDISVIETPPEGRRPVKTYVGPYDEELVRRALEREHERRGQAFYLHNRVETIAETAERLRALCPQLRFAVAHGQMEERELEAVMMDYVRGRSDVLVCTSIIESGLDIPQANTLIVEGAERFGLAQLYQIRGRVGRSRERASAYLLYDSAGALTPEAAQRLSALSDHTELGTGLALAMRDLEIRGAGDLLGPEQSGHVAALGFELYMQMLQEAVGEAAARDGADGRVGAAGIGEAADGDVAIGQEDGAPTPAGVDAGARAVGPAEPVRFDVNVDAYVPADYVPYERAKIEIHRRLASALEVADVEMLREELEDRFGPVPEPLANLLALTRARIKFGLAGVRSVSFHGDRLAVAPVELDSKGARRLHEALPGALYEAGRSRVTVRVPADGPERFPAVVRAADVLLTITERAGNSS
jgi:transcription-repair coupling factor (superfamily II helicase)